MRNRSGRLTSLFSLLLSIGACIGALESIAAGYHGYYVKDSSAGFRFYDILATRSDSIVIDGDFDEAEGWDFAEPAGREIFKYDRRDARIAVALAWDDTNLYVAVQAQDDLILEDASGDSFDTLKGDNVEFYVDPDLSRDSVLQTTDYVLAFTLGKSHVRFDKGTGAAGETQYGGVEPAVASSWIAVSLDGTLNDLSGASRGWQMEMRIPWSAMGRSAPVSGDMLGVAPLFLERDDEVTPIGSVNEDVWDQPFEINRFYKLSGDGISGPSTYARAYFVDPSDVIAPGAIGDLSIAAPEQPGPFSLPIRFTAPGEDGGTGWCRGYEIRTHTDPIVSEAAWDAATPYPNEFRPQRAGEIEEFEIFGLAPATGHDVGVRCRDHAGNLADLSNSLSVGTSAAPTDPGDHGFARVSPAGPYLMRQDGAPLVAIGDHMAVSWRLVNTAYNGLMYNPVSGTQVNWQTCTGTGADPDCGSPDDVLRSYFRDTLAASGVNVMRLFLEDLSLPVPAPVVANGLPFLEFPASTTGANINPTMQDMLDDVLRIAKDEGIYVVLVPFDTFYYKSRLSTHFPYNEELGGIPGVTTPEHLFTNADAMQAMVKRLEVISGWTLEGGDYTVSTHPNILYVDILNEWDGGDWASLPDDSSCSGPTLTPCTRIAFMENFIAAVRGFFPNHLIAGSVVEWAPQNLKADLVLNGQSFDLIDIHAYTRATRDPKAAGSGDTELTARGALEANRMARYYQGNSVGHRPVFVSEFSHIEFFVSGYDESWTGQVDIEQMHNMLWMLLASGASNTGLRFPGIALGDTGPLLPTGMRDYQRAIRNFISGSGIDFARFAPHSIDHRLATTHPSQTIHARGVLDDDRGGIIYLLQDLRAGSGSVTGAQLSLDGISSEVSDVPLSYWDPYDLLATSAMASASVAVVDGIATIALPDFDRGLAIVLPEPGNATLQTVALCSLLMVARARRRELRSARFPG